MNLVQRYWEDNNGALLVRRLHEELPASSELIDYRGPDGEMNRVPVKSGLVQVGSDGTDYRGFEWFYWRRKINSEHVTLKGHTGRVMSVGFSPDSRRLASASEDQTIKVWDVATGRVIRTLKRYSDPMGKIAFGLGGRLLTCMDRQGSVKTWDVETGQEVDRLGVAPDALNVAVSPDRKRVASANLGESGTVLVQWNIPPHAGDPHP